VYLKISIKVLLTEHPAWLIIELRQQFIKEQVRK